MKKTIIILAALSGLTQTTLASAGPDFNLIQIARKNQLAHDAKEAVKRAAPEQLAPASKKMSAADAKALPVADRKDASRGLGEVH